MADRFDKSFPMNSKNGKMDFDQEIKRAGNAGQKQMNTQPDGDIEGFLGVDDLDRIRRENLRHKTK